MNASASNKSKSRAKSVQKVKTNQKLNATVDHAARLKCDENSIYMRLYKEKDSEKRKKEKDELKQKYTERYSFQPNVNNKDNKSKPSRKNFEERLMKYQNNKKEKDKDAKALADKEFNKKFPFKPDIHKSDEKTSGDKVSKSS